MISNSRLFAVGFTALLSASQAQAGTVQTNFFDRTAASILACYEATGDVLATYDEEGRCSEESDLSAWTLSSIQPRGVELTQFTSLDSRVPTVGEYEGRVSFHNAEGRLCSFNMTVSYSGEDILVLTGAFACP